MSPNEQLDKWCAGESVHNRERDECCPDFSCCVKTINTPIIERMLFRDRPDLRDSMLMMFLGGLLKDQPVHIAGSTEGAA